MKLNRKEHNRFIQWLDRTAETNPFLWLPCVLMLVLALAGEGIAEQHRNTEKAVTETPRTMRKPLALRVLAMSLALAFGFMLTNDLGQAVYADEYYIDASDIDLGDDTDIIEGSKSENCFDVYSDPDLTYGDLTYIIENGKVTVDYYEGTDTDVVIPDTIDNLPVTSIGEYAFYGCSELTRVTIPDSIEFIGESAFSECEKLTSISIPNGVTFIADWAFMGCVSLTSITIPDSVTSMGMGVFDDCNELTIYGVPGSYAEEYADEYKIPFEVISDEHIHIPSDKILSDETWHWYKCMYCDYKVDIDWHNPIWVKEDGYHYQYCPDCGWKSDNEPHERKWNTSDDKLHWEECVCGLKTEAHEHRFDTCWETDESDHWHECVVCHSKKDVEIHKWEWNSYFSEHECSICAEVSENHVYKWNHNENVHWKECVCGIKTKNSFHEFGDGFFTIDDDGTNVKRYICICGYFYDEPIAHTHTAGSKWEYDDENHWQKCTECGRIVNIANHNYRITETKPTNTTTGKRVYTCKCGKSYSETIPMLGHTHISGTAWFNDKDYHWHMCTVCNETIDKTAHNYGTEWQSDSTGHWHECTCGKKIDSASHNSNDRIVTESSAGTTITYSCSVCGRVMKTETIPATGGENVSYDPSDNGFYDPSDNVSSYPSSLVIPSTANAQRMPYISNDPAIEGWENIAAYINASAERAVIPISMNGETEIPQNIIACIQNRDVTLKINMTGGDVWTVNGFDIASPQTVSLRVSSKSNKIPDSVIDGLNSELEAKEYRLYHNGNFGFRASLTFNLSKKYNNHYAELYYYNTKTKQLEFVDESYVSNRQVTFKLTHASYYLIAFNSIPLYDDVSSGAGVFEDLVPIETSAMPETNGVTIPAIKLPQIMKCSNKKRRYRVLKKRRLDDMVFVY